MWGVIFSVLALCVVTNLDLFNGGEGINEDI
jgi:hypothetical protein